MIDSNFTHGLCFIVWLLPLHSSSCDLASLFKLLTYSCQMLVIGTLSIFLFKSSGVFPESPCNSSCWQNRQLYLFFIYPSICSPKCHLYWCWHQCPEKLSVWNLSRIPWMSRLLCLVYWFCLFRSYSNVEILLSKFATLSWSFVLSPLNVSKIKSWTFDRLPNTRSCLTTTSWLLMLENVLYLSDFRPSSEFTKKVLVSSPHSLHCRFQ